MAERIPLRTLRNEASSVLRRVESGESLTVTVDGRPVADLVPHRERRRFLERSDLARVLEGRRADAGLRDDVRRLVPDTTDDA